MFVLIHLSFLFNNILLVFNNIFLTFSKFNVFVLSHLILKGMGVAQLGLSFLNRLYCVSKIKSKAHYFSLKIWVVPVVKQWHKDNIFLLILKQFLSIDLNFFS